MTMTHDDYQHRAGACVGFTMQQVCGYTNNEREDAIRLQLWERLDDNFDVAEYEFEEASKNVLIGFSEDLEDYNRFTPRQILKITDLLRKKIDDKFGDAEGNVL